MIASLKNNWCKATLSELAADTHNSCVIGPFGSDLKTSDYVDEGIPVVFVKNVRPGFYDPSHRRFVSEDKAEDLAYHKVIPGDILITKMGLPPCVAALYPELERPGIVTADIIKLTLDQGKADSGFIIHYLNSPFAKAEVKRITNGVTRPKVTLADFKQITIPLPPLTEQRRIAAILDKADAIRRKREEGIRLTEELLRSTFLEMFGDPVTNPTQPLAEVAAIASGVTKGRRLNGNVMIVPYLRVANVQDGFLNLDEIKFIEALPEEVESLALQRGDIVMTEGGDHDKLGRGAIWNQDIPNFIHQNHVFRVRVDLNRLLPHYFATFLRTAQAKAYFLRCAKKTTNLATINMTQLKGLSVPIPPLSLQRKFEQATRAILKASAARKRATAEADQLFGSLVQRAFRGEL